MANKKTGFDYFNLDTYRYLDLKIKRLKKVHGATGIAIYDYILSNIYRENGYFIEWSEHFCFDISDYFDLTEDLVRDIVKSCLEIELFSDNHFKKFSILTSKGIQERYNEMSKACRRSGFEIAEEYVVTPHNVVKNTQNDVKTGQNAEECADSSAILRIPPQNYDIPPHSSYILPQSKVKESKVSKGRKGERVEESGLSPDPQPQNAEESIELVSKNKKQNKKNNRPARPKTTFEESEWNENLDGWLAAAPSEWSEAKKRHYFQRAKGWSIENPGKKRVDWLETVIGWESDRPWQEPKSTKESPTQTDDITRIIDEFNALTQSQYDKADEAIRGYLAGRMMDGCKLQDMLDVIALKAVQWGSGDERKFLKFQTLFKPQNYPGYVQEVRDAKAGKIKVLNKNESAYDRIQRKIDAALGRTQPA